MIMAAGMGTRFGHYTDLVPKGFVSIGDKPMILRSIEVLLSCGITRIVIGTGYRCEVYEELKKDYPLIETCFSPLSAAACIFSRTVPKACPLIMVCVCKSAIIFVM